MRIEYYKKDVYGQTLMYIKDPVNASFITILTGRVTITQRDMDAFRGLFRVEFVEVLPG